MSESVTESKKKELFAAAHAALRIAMMQADSMKDSPTVSPEEVGRLYNHVVNAGIRTVQFSKAMIPTSPPEQTAQSPQ